MSWLKKMVKRASRGEKSSPGKKGPDRDRGMKPARKGGKPDRAPDRDRMKKEQLKKEQLRKAGAEGASNVPEDIEKTFRKREESYRRKREELQELIKRGEDGDAPARKLEELEKRWAEESSALKGKIRELKG